MLKVQENGPTTKLPYPHWKPRHVTVLLGDFNNLQKLFIIPNSFPKLQHFSLGLERRPPEDLDPAPASFPFDDIEIEKLRDRITKERGLGLVYEELTDDFHLLRMGKVEELPPERSN